MLAFLFKGKLKDSSTRVFRKSSRLTMVGSLDELERVRAEDFIRRANEAAEKQWHQVQEGSGGVMVSAPRAEGTTHVFACLSKDCG